MTTPVGSSPGPWLPTESPEETYVVRSGDTLSAIARKLGLTLADILKANPLIKDPNRIQVGQQLKLPAAGSPLRGAERPAADNARGLDVFERMAPVPAKTQAPPKAVSTTATADPSGASGSGFFSKLKTFWNGLFAPSGAQTASATTAVAATAAAGGVKLSLGPNERYRDAILLASQRTGMEPAAMAALINAEAGRVKGAALNRLTDETFHARHPELGGRPLTKADTELTREWKQINAEMSRVWDPSVANLDGLSTATGLTQFIEGTWLEVAQKPGTYLNEVARRKGHLGEKNELASGKTSELLALRTDATLSIVAAAEYGKSNLEELGRRGLITGKLTDDEKARLTYLAHHEGADGAEAFLRNTLTDAQAKRLLNRNIKDAEQRAALVEKHGGEAAAYKAWLNEYIERNVRPEAFR